MSIQRYWASLKASFVGTITSISSLKAKAIGVDQKNNGVKEEEPVVVFSQESKAKPEESTNGTNGHTDSTDEGRTSNGHDAKIPEESASSNGHAETSNGTEKVEETKSTNGHVEVPEKMEQGEGLKQPAEEANDDGDESDSSSSSEEVVVKKIPSSRHGEVVESSDDDESCVPNPDIERLIMEAKSCQKCKTVYETPAEASRCISDHKRVRCYFCFYVCKNMENLFEHFRQSHQHGTRDRFLSCPYCGQQVPFKSVSCHVISTHLMEKKIGTRSSRRSRPHPDSPSAKKLKQSDDILWVD